MSTSKVWLHTGAPCHGCTGIGDHWRALHAAGVPFAVYSVEGAGLIVEASAYPGATLVYRTLATDVAAYDLSPVDAAGRAWSILMDRLPPEIKALKGRVWVEVGNEQDKTRADWLGHYYAELAGYVLANGYRLCAAGWSTGEPEPEHWNLPGWARYLDRCAEYPERLAVSVHEYSLDADDIMAGSPWLVGRVKFLFEACRAQGIRPPTVFVTEAGWTHNDLPQADKAREDINALARLYAGYPSVKAAFLWSAMGGGDKRTLAAELNALLPWLTEYAVTTRLPDVDDGPVEPPPPDPVRHKAIVLKVPQDVTAGEWQQAAAYGFTYRHTMTASHDDMLTILGGGNEQSYVKLCWPGRQVDVAGLIEVAGYSWVPLFEEPPDDTPFAFVVYPLDGPRVVTQAFGARPEVYAQYGFPGHEGIDLQAASGAAVRAVADGQVTKVTTTGNYGHRGDVSHAGGWVTTYAHLSQFAGLAVGDAVTAGQVIGYAGSTGNSTGAHLHLGLKRPGYTFTDEAGTVWPFNIFDPSGYIAPLLPPAETTVDLLPYFQGTHRRQFDMGHDVNGGGTQTVQVWHLGPSDWLYVKGEAGEYERLGLRTWNGAEWIFRFEDTSESPDRFYAHYMTAGGAIGAPWLPRRAVAGRWYETPKFVQHYRKGDCAKQDGGPVTDKLRLVAGPRAVLYGDSGATLPDVITVEWSGGEQYDFAAGRGCVAFRDAGRRFWFIGDLQGRPDRTYRKPGCIPLGW
jgi:murein DD-endopeptidase MepM/ murein hydrolase activator NlpD